MFDRELLDVMEYYEEHPHTLGDALVREQMHER
jgi:hypothetical protein